MPVPGDNFHVTRSNDPLAEIIAADEISGGVKVQRVKLTFGVDGTMTDVSAADPLPVTLGGETVNVNVLGGSVEALPHAIGGTKHTPSTLAALNALVSDGTLDKTTDPRTPIPHAVSHQNGGSDEIATSTPASGAIPKATGSGTLAPGWLPAATESAQGAAEIATQAETDTGSDDVRLVTPLKLKTTPLANRDTTAFHSNIALEFNALTAKATPIPADQFVIEDSASGPGNKRSLTLSNLQAYLQANLINNSFQLTATNALSTTSLTDVLIPGMTVTPGAGTYLVMFSMTASHSKTNETTFGSIYVNGVQIPHSEREVGGQSGNLGNIGSQIAVIVGAGQTIEAMWRVSSNSGGGFGATPGPRSMTVIKLAP